MGGNWRQFHLVIFQQFSRCVIDSRQRCLIASLRLSQRKFGLRQLRLGIQYKKYGAAPELILPFFRLEVLLCQISGNLRCLERQFRLLQLMHRVRHIQAHLLCRPRLPILISMLRHFRIGEVRLCRVIFNG